ncbi:MAG: InlB B-repeat-containing protein [Clostridiales bacterium]|nr:InlB B-repeat-containing protein [Clostridiales bacterium]
MKKNFKRFLSLVLSMVMIMALIPTQAFAMEVSETSEPVLTGSAANGDSEEEDADSEFSVEDTDNDEDRADNVSDVEAEKSEEDSELLSQEKKEVSLSNEESLMDEEDTDTDEETTAEMMTEKANNSEEDISVVSDEEETTYSYRYKIYTWNDTTYNYYRPYKTVSNVTSESAVVSIPTGSISLDTVTIEEEEYELVGWTVSSGNYKALRTEAECVVGENITTDISELASNRYVEVFAVYAKVEKEYTVTFESNGGSETESQTVKAGETAAEPEEPTLDGYTFAGWYSDADLTEKYDFSSAVTENITLYAKWEAVTYSYRYKIYTWNDTTYNYYRPYKTVSNVTSESAVVSIPTGSISLDTVTIEEEEYELVGWTVSSGNYKALRTEAECVVGENITTDISELASNRYVEVFAVYAKVEKEYTVTFESNGGSETESQTVKAGETAAEPEEPTLDGYTFAGWYSDADLTEKYDFSSAVTENITLYAKWETATGSECIRADILWSIVIWMRKKTFIRDCLLYWLRRNLILFG